MINWTSILQLRYNQHVFIYFDKIEKLNDMYKKMIEQNNGDFVFLENNGLTDQSEITKISLDIKNFVENDNKKILILTQGTLGKIVKEEKTGDFLKILRRKNKKTVILCYNYLWNKIIIEEGIAWAVMDENQIVSQFGTMEKFNGIKDLIAEAKSPFKNPLNNN